MPEGVFRTAQFAVWCKIEQCDLFHSVTCFSHIISNTSSTLQPPRNYCLERAYKVCFIEPPYDYCQEMVLEICWSRFDVI